METSVYFQKAVELERRVVSARSRRSVAWPQRSCAPSSAAGPSCLSLDDSVDSRVVRESYLSVSSFLIVSDLVTMESVSEKAARPRTRRV